MAAMLAVVRSVEEALDAAAAGADRVAVAGPVPGAHPFGRRKAPEIPLGQMFGPDPDPLRLVSAIAFAHVDVLWLPFDSFWHAAVRQAVSTERSVIGLVPQERHLGEELCAEAAGLGLQGLLVGGEPFASDRLLDTWPIAALAAFVPLCRARGLSIAFCGALEPPDVPRLLALEPDELCFDIALLDGTGRLDQERVRSLRELMGASSRQVAPTPPGPKRLDRIFVRDWTVPMSIGAYARERGESQRVRFCVEAEVVPGTGDAGGMAGVVSYDLITDTIARLAATHVDLVETLAEALAAAVLAHPRVAAVEVTVEKLDVGPGSVGCRIVRTRGA